MAAPTIPPFPFPAATHEDSVRYLDKVPTGPPNRDESRFVWHNGLYVWADSKWNLMHDTTTMGLTVDIKTAVVGQGQKTLHFVGGILTSMT